MHRMTLVAGFSGLLTLALLGSASAQTPAAEPSMGCRLFPLACPGPVPPKPAPLMGTPEDQAAEAAPPPAAMPSKHHRKAHRHAAAAPAEPAQ